MKLDRYILLSSKEVFFPDFPSIPVMMPFSDFEKQKAPYWWVNYNKLKHEMPESISKASVETLFSAFGGLMCLLAAEYGGAFINAKQHFDARRVLQISMRPNGHQGMKYFISGRKDWSAVPFPLDF